MPDWAGTEAGGEERRRGKEGPRGAAYVGVELPHEAGEVVVLEVLGEQIPAELGLVGDDEAGPRRRPRHHGVRGRVVHHLVRLAQERRQRGRAPAARLHPRPKTSLPSSPPAQAAAAAAAAAAGARRMPGVIRGKRLAAACLGLVGGRGALALGIGLAEIPRRLDCAAWASSAGLGRGGLLVGSGWVVR